MTLKNSDNIQRQVPRLLLKVLTPWTDELASEYDRERSHQSTKTSWWKKKTKIGARRDMTFSSNNQRSISLCVVCTNTWGVNWSNLSISFVLLKDLNVLQNQSRTPPYVSALMHQAHPLAWGSNQKNKNNRKKQEAHDKLSGPQIDPSSLSRWSHACGFIVSLIPGLWLQIEPCKC